MATPKFMSARGAQGKGNSSTNKTSVGKKNSGSGAKFTTSKSKKTDMPVKKESKPTRAYKSKDKGVPTTGKKSTMKITAGSKGKPSGGKKKASASN